MKPFSTIAKRFLVAGSLLLVTACGSNGVTEPSAKKSGYLTVSASVNSATGIVADTSATVSEAPVAPTTTTTKSGRGQSGMSHPTASGYNVPAN